MRRVAVLVMILVVVPVQAAVAAELDELMDESRSADYAAEQIVSCSTPDGARDAIVRVTQSGGELRVSSSLADDVEVAVASGTWSLRRGGEVITETAVGEGKGKTEPLYTIGDEQAVEYLGRAAMSYLLIRDGMPRAELIFDDETGVLVNAITYTTSGDVYCERRFVSLVLDVDPAPGPTVQDSEAIPPTLLDDSTLPGLVAGFERLDQYEDEDGVRFAYYSDGFFSFALFETPTRVALPEATMVSFEPGDYRRLFTAGQVTYVWETETGGAALIGDLPPDLHEAVLTEMPEPHRPGFLRRWWRSLFG